MTIRLGAESATMSRLPPNEATSTSATTQRDNRKSVRFARGADVYITTDAEAENTLSSDELWYSRKDLKRFKAHTVQIASDIIQGEHGHKASLYWQHVLQRAYEAVHEQAWHYQQRQQELHEQKQRLAASKGHCQSPLCTSSLEDEDNAATIRGLLSDSEGANLRDLYSYNSLCPLGMEHLLVDVMAHDAACRQHELLDRIVVMEERCGHALPDLLPDLIRMSCQSLTRGPQWMAHQIALALAASQGYVADTTRPRQAQQQPLHLAPASKSARLSSLPPKLVPVVDDSSVSSGSSTYSIPRETLSNTSKAAC